MNIIVTKDNVKIAEQSLVHKGEYNVNPLIFSFSAEYDGLSKMAVFSTLVKTYETAITNGSCIIPYEVLKDRGILKIGVYGYTIEDDVIVKRYSPAPITIPINDGSYIPNASNPEQENPTQFEQFMEQLEGDIDDLNDDINVLGQSVVDLQTNKQDKLTAGTGINIDANNVISTQGQANTIESISVNGTPQTIANKNVDISVPTATSQLNNDSGFIDSSVNNLVNYELKAGVGHSIALDIDTNYVMTLKLKNSSGQVISTGSIDLPLESVVVDGSYDSATKEVVLVLENGNTIRFSVADLVSGLQTEITSENKLASDLVDDTDQANKFVSVAEKETWNNKQNAINSNNKLSADLVDDGNTTNKFVTSAEKTTWNNKSDFTGNYNDLTNKPDLTIYEEKTDAEEKYETLLSQIPTATATGTTINVQDSSNLPIKDIKIKGNSSGTVTGDNTVVITGKNFFDINADKTTGNAAYSFHYYLKPNTTYTISSDVPISNVGNIYANSGSSAQRVYIDHPQKITSNSEGYFYVAVRFRPVDDDSATFNAYEAILNGLYYLQIEEGEAATDYEPYTSQEQLLSLEDIQLAPTDEIARVNNEWCINDTPITATTLISQLENVLKMRTIKNTTNMWLKPSGTNAQGGLTLTYYQDLQTLTDRITSLEARVSLLE